MADTLFNKRICHPVFPFKKLETHAAKECYHIGIMLMPRQKQDGFTIVELLIVIVVIAILAAITMVVYAGLNNRATIAVLESNLTQAAKQLSMDKSINDSFPTDDDTSHLGANAGITYEYSSDGSTFCLSAKKGTIAYHITHNSHPQEGACAGHAGPGGVTPLLLISPNESRNAAGSITLHASTDASVVPFDGSNAWLIAAGTRVRLPSGLPWYTEGLGAPFGIYMRMAIDTYPDATIRLLEQGSGSPDWPATARLEISPTGIRSKIHNSITGTLVQPPLGQPISFYMGRSQGPGKNHRTIINGSDQTSAASYEGETRILASDRVMLHSTSSTISARVAAVIWFKRPLTTDEVARLDSLPTSGLTWANITATQP